MGSRLFKNKNQYNTWADMPYAAINKVEGDARRERIEANRKSTEGLAPDAFADEADIPESDAQGTYYPVANIFYEREDNNG
tara:strand:- start:123 stop:365 length:243 start_codon:yes stop_codon:yes gene_type:complete